MTLGFFTPIAVFSGVGNPFRRAAFGRSRRHWSVRHRVEVSESRVPTNPLFFTRVTCFFGAVFRGNWHGEVAIKVFNMDMDDDNILDAFKQEVKQF